MWIFSSVIGHYKKRHQNGPFSVSIVLKNEERSRQLSAFVNGVTYSVRRYTYKNKAA